MTNEARPADRLAVPKVTIKFHIHGDFYRFLGPGVPPVGPMGSAYPPQAPYGQTGVFYR